MHSVGQESRQEWRDCHPSAMFICIANAFTLKLGNSVPPSRGVHRNFEKGFPIQLSDCYIRVVYIG